MKYLSLLFSVFLFSPLAVSAAGASITVEQHSDIEVFGTWTISFPTQETHTRTDRLLPIPDALPGRYTLFVETPDGTNASIDLLESGVLVRTVAQPQISFEAKEGDDIRLVVQLRLVNFGKVGVNSEPNGIPFDLVGPNGLRKSGVTPMEFSRVPIGNYSVQYKPDGCPIPSAKSDVLAKDKAVYFGFKIVCDTLVRVEKKIEEHVSTETDKGTVVFTDVPTNAWFSLYVARVAKRGILTGYRDTSGNFTGLFGPANFVTIGELAKIMHVMADINETTVSVPPRNPLAPGRWFTKYIASAEERGWSIFQNSQLDLLRPATRGEVMVTLLQVLDLPLQWPKGQMFSDVTVRTPFAHAIETAAQLELVSGSTDAQGKPTGLFGPQDFVTRAELSKILITVQEKYQKSASSTEQ